MCVKTEATKYAFFMFCIFAGAGITYAGYVIGTGLI